MKEIKICKTKRGKIEYSIEGSGPVVLVVHGGHSSCRGEFCQQHLIDSGFTVLVPSRPGYGATPIESGRDAAATAHLFAALLEALQIDSVSVIGISAGGPSALEFARLYPSLVEKLVLESSVVKPWFHPLTPQYYGARVIFHPARQKKFWQGLREKLQKDEKKTLLENMKIFTRLDPEQLLQKLSAQEIEFLKDGLVIKNDSGSGFVRDIEHRAHHIEEISCPVLIIHSLHDGTVPFSHAEYACRKISGAQLYHAPVDSHFLYVGPGSQQVLQKRQAFLMGA